MFRLQRPWFDPLVYLQANVARLAQVGNGDMASTERDGIRIRSCHWICSCNLRKKESSKPWRKAFARRSWPEDDRGRTGLQSRCWGGWYTEEEIEAATKAIRDSMDPTTVGFGFICPEILDFEAAFAEYCGGG